jgi:hypothetical protein
LPSLLPSPSPVFTRTSIPALRGRRPERRDCPPRQPSCRAAVPTIAAARRCGQLPLGWSRRTLPPDRSAVCPTPQGRLHEITRQFKRPVRLMRPYQGRLAICLPCGRPVGERLDAHKGRPCVIGYRVRGVCRPCFRAVCRFSALQHPITRRAEPGGLPRHEARARPIRRVELAGCRAGRLRRLMGRTPRWSGCLDYAAAESYPALAHLPLAGRRAGWRCRSEAVRPIIRSTAVFVSNYW